MSTGTVCQLCRKHSGDNAPVCTTCAHHTHTALHTVADWLAEDLDTLLTRQTRYGTPTTPHTHTPDPPLPCDLRATEARTILHTTLTAWATTIRDAIGGTPPARLAPLAAWLTHYTDWLRHAPYAPQANDEIQAAVTQALRLVDIPPRPEYAGHCTTCGQPVYAVHLRPGLPCRRPGCTGTVPDPHQARLDRLRALDDTLMTPAEASTCLARAGLTLTPSAIRGHARRGNLSQRGTRRILTRSQQPGTARRTVTVPVYRFGDILNIALHPPARTLRRTQVAQAS